MYNKIEMRVILKFLLFFSVFFTLSKTYPLYGESAASLFTEPFTKALTYHNIKPIFYDIDVRFDTTTQLLEINTNLYFKPEEDKIKKIVVFLNSGLNISSIRLNGKETKFGYKQFILGMPVNIVRIFPDEPLKMNEKYILSVNYKSGFNPKPAFPGIEISINEEGFIAEWTSFWYPMVYPKEFYTMDIKAGVPPRFIVITNGKLIKKISNDNQQTFFYQIKEPIWRTGLIIGEFEKVSKEEKGVNFELYYKEKYVKNPTRVLEDFMSVINFYQRAFGRLSPKDLRVIIGAERDEYNAASSESYIVLFYPYFKSKYIDENYSDLLHILAHETAHMWWATEVGLNFTSLDSEFIIESLAEYSAALFFSRRFCPSRIFQANVFRDYNNKVIKLDPKEKTPLRKTSQLDSGYITTFYFKGVLIYRMLNYILGDEDFYKGIQLFLQRYKYKFPVANDLQKTLEEVSNKKLDWFFYTYLDTTKELDIGIEDVKTTEKNGKYLTDILIKNKGEVLMPVEAEVLIVTREKEYIRKIGLSQKINNISLIHNEEITSIWIDPNNWFLDINLEDNIWARGLEHYKQAVDFLKKIHYKAAYIEIQKALNLSPELIFDLRILERVQNIYELNKESNQFASMCKKLMKRYNKKEEVELLKYFLDRSIVFKRKKCIKNWLFIGPFDNKDNKGFDKKYLPEEEINITKFYKGKDDISITWRQPYEKDAWGIIYLKNLFLPNEEVVCYALSYIYSPKQMGAEFLIVLEGGCKIWLNDKEVFKKDFSKMYFHTYFVPVTLNKGMNKILIKLCSGKDGWGFSFRVADMKWDPLKNLKYSVSST